MSGQEAQRYVVIERVVSKQITQAAAAAQLGLSVRQIKRLTRQVRLHGALGLISQRRGITSNRGIDAGVRERFVGIVREHYADFGPQLAYEHLVCEHNFGHSKETLRQWMQAAGLWQIKHRRTPKQHSPRARRACVGELVQIDGSHHDWFEGRAPKCCLIAFIDDASGQVLGARLSATETTQAYFDVMRQSIERHGLPLAYYSDRHSIFTKHNSEDAKPTQFERALLQLDIESICAHSPQAKGRIERLFQTLQDRLVKAMRLAGINTMAQANAWLPSYLAKHNARFAVPPQNAANAHRAWSASAEQLANICALHHQRSLSEQLSCQFGGDILQLHPHQAHAPRGKAQVDITEHADGTLVLSYRGHILQHQRFTVNEHLKRGKTVDDKGVNARVDDVLKRQRQKIARLQAQITHQDSQRATGVYTPANSTNLPPTPPRAATGRYGLRPAQPVAAQPPPR